MREGGKEERDGTEEGQNKGVLGLRREKRETGV